MIRIGAPLALPRAAGLNPTRLPHRPPLPAPVRRKLELEEAPPPAPWGREAQETAAPLPLGSGPLPDACACAMQRQDSAWSTLTDMGALEEPAAPSTPEQSSSSRIAPAALPAWAAVEAPLGFALQVCARRSGAAPGLWGGGGAGAGRCGAAPQPRSRHGAEGGSAQVGQQARRYRRSPPLPLPPLPARRRPGGRSWCGCSRW